MDVIKKLQDKALQAKRESNNIEFKSKFDVRSTEHWCEIIKDLVAVSNSGGGIILFGVNNDGSCSAFDCSQILATDPAMITSKVAKYTHIQFSGFDILELEKSGHTIAGVEIRRSRIPMVFVKEGSYTVHGQKKTAFARGTLYFRHGAKSEPADSHDLKKVIEREQASVTKSLLNRVRTVTAIPLDKEVTVQTTNSGQGPNVSVVLSGDPDATRMELLDSNRTHPYRLKDIVELVNEKLKDREKVNSYDIQCIRWVYDIDDDVKYFYKPLHTSPHYSRRFVDMIISKYNKDDSIFEKAREKCRP